MTQLVLQTTKPCQAVKSRKPLHPLDKIIPFTFNSTKRIVEDHGELEKIREFIATILKREMP